MYITFLTLFNVGGVAEFEIEKEIIDRSFTILIFLSNWLQTVNETVSKRKQIIFII